MIDLNNCAEHCRLNNLDLYKYVASLEFNVKYDDVTNTQRSIIKSALFQVAYGKIHK